MLAAQPDYLPRLALARTSTNLRPLTDTFVGRERELAELTALVRTDGTRLVTLLAPGGYGKSRLATELCARLLGGFGEGVFEVRLARIGAAERIAETIAAATGLQLAGNRPPLEQVLDYLRAKELLLHIENLEHLLAGTPLISALLDAAPGVRLLVTSRAPLGLPGEQVYPLAPLQCGAGSDSVYLFATRALRVRPDFSLDAAAAPLVERLCTRLQGVPLAIELAAAWADRFALPALDSALEQQLALDAAAGQPASGNASLRAACDWSWQQLAPAEQTALMQLATFRGGFFAVEAQALLGLAGARIADLLAELCRRSWLTSFTAEGKVRYTLRNVASREYAWEQLARTHADAGPESAPAGQASLYRRARAAHARCFAQLVATEGEKLKGSPGSGQLVALHRLKLLEKENILAALDTALELDDLECLLLLARDLGRLMEMTSEFALLEQCYARLLDSALRLVQPQLELHARGGLGAAAYRFGRYDECTAQAQAVAQLAQRLGQTSVQADAQRVLGLVAYTRGDYPAALELLHSALELSRSAADPPGEASVLNNLGNAEVAVGERSAARASYERCLELRRASGDRYGEAMCLNNLGNLELREGHLPAGLELTQQCLSIRRELCDLHGQAASLGNLAIALYSSGAVDAARDSFRQALAIQRSLGDRLGMAGTLNNLGAVERGQRDFGGAIEFYRQAIALSREIGYGLAEATALLNLGTAQCELDNYAAAREAYALVLPLLVRLGGLNYLPKAVALAGAVLAEAGVWPQAISAMHGGLFHAPARHCTIEPEEQAVLDRGWAAVAGGGPDEAQVQQLKSAAESQSLDELAQQTLLALTGTAPGA